MIRIRNKSFLTHNTTKTKRHFSDNYRRIAIVFTIETREGWPLLIVETEVNGDSKSTNERGPS